MRHPKADAELRRAVGRAVKLAREEARWPAATLGREVGLSDGFVHNVEAGRGGLSLDTLVKIGEKLGVPGWKLLRHAQRALAAEAAAAAGDGEGERAA